jgi:hypothetical protein
MTTIVAPQASMSAAKVADGKRGGGRPGEREQPEPGQVRYTALGLLIPALSFGVAWWLHGSTASTYRIGSQWSAFTGLFVLALAIERALEPFSSKIGPDKATRTSPSQVEKCRRLTAVVTWGVATGLGFLLCAQLNITLLQAVRANGSGQPPFWADLLVTGLVVGAGTKPLHDLVCSIEHSKQARQNPPGGGAGQ